MWHYLHHRKGNSGHQIAAATKLCTVYSPSCFRLLISQNLSQTTYDTGHTLCIIREYVSKSCTAATNICGSSICDLPHDTLLAPTILRLILDFWKMYALPTYGESTYSGSALVSSNRPRGHWDRLYVQMCVCEHIYIYIRGVTGGTDQTSGGCSLCYTIPI